MAERGYGWSVGRFDWLNDPASKVNRYWRVIEEGSNATDWPWQGQRIVGLWGPKAGPRGRLITGDLSAFQSGRDDQKFVPFFRNRGKGLNAAARAALAYFFEGGRGKNMDLIRADPRGNRNAASARRRFYFWMMMVGKERGPTLDQLPFVQGIVMREVQAGNYYARALEAFNPMDRELDALRRIFGGADVSTRSGLRQARTLQAFDSYSRYADEVRPKTRPTPGGARRYSSHTSRHGGRFAASVDMSFVAQDFRRNALGHFTSYQGDLQQANRQIAAEFQSRVVQLMQQERRRPVSGALIAATKDERNVAVN